MEITNGASGFTANRPGDYLLESIAEMQDYATDWSRTYHHACPNMALERLCEKGESRM